VGPWSRLDAVAKNIPFYYRERNSEPSSYTNLAISAFVRRSINKSAKYIL